jgi:hypothetical protein
MKPSATSARKKAIAAQACAEGRSTARNAAIRKNISQCVATNEKIVLSLETGAEPHDGQTASSDCTVKTAPQREQRTSRMAVLIP